MPDQHIRGEKRAGTVDGLAFSVVADLVESLMGIPGAVAVAHAGGADAAGLAPPGTEPAYLLYYRGTLDAAALRKLEFEGKVGEPGVRAAC